MKFLKLLIWGMILLFPIANASHYIVGYVENATDNTSPNGRIVEVRNSLSQTLNDVVGPLGNAKRDNIYMVDCELFPVPCDIGDVLNISLVDDGSGYIGEEIIQVTVTSAGFDRADNITMVNPLIFNSTTLDDANTLILNEVDLVPAAKQNVTCSSVVAKLSGDTGISNGSAEIYFYSTSGVGLGDDNNEHYTNDSCIVDTGYGSSVEAQVNCTFEVEYYANAGVWQCFMNVTDNSSISVQDYDNSTFNELLAIEVISPMNFSGVTQDRVSAETVSEVTNYGNIEINLSLSGYAATEEDGFAMSCNNLENTNISVEELKYNLSGSTSGNITFSELNLYYTNLSDTPVVNKIDLAARQNDVTNEALMSTYWRVHVPKEATGNCSGRIVFGAVKAGV